MKYLVTDGVDSWEFQSMQEVAKFVQEREVSLDSVVIEKMVALTPNEAKKLLRRELRQSIVKMMARFPTEQKKDILQSFLMAYLSIQDWQQIPRKTMLENFDTIKENEPEKAAHMIKDALALIASRW